MMEFILGLAIGTALTWLIYTVLIKVATHRAEKQIDELISVLKEEQKNIVSARVEQHQGIFYIYNAKNDSFMAQGTTLAELRSNIQSRWQEARVYVTEGDADVVKALKSTQTNMETERA